MTVNSDHDLLLPFIILTEDNISENDNVEQILAQLAKLEELYGKCRHKFGEDSENIASMEFYLAQLNVCIGNLDKAKSYYDHAMPIIEASSYLSQEDIGRIIVPYCFFLYINGNLEDAIDRLEKQLMVLKKTIVDEPYWFVTDLLTSIYRAKEEYQKLVALECEQFAILTKEHCIKYGNEITQNNIDFEEPLANKIISVCLSLGANFSHLNQYREAKRYLEIGYHIAYFMYGDKDERALKLNFNMAVNEMYLKDSIEGRRQLEFVYKDMEKYLGVENIYTQKAKTALRELDKEDNRLPS